MIADHPSFHLKPGTTPLLVSLPHCGELIPDELRPRYLPRALAVEDTDWHLHKLYAFAAEMGASVLQPRASRFVIDLNRPSDNAPMYPGANNTELCPTRFFSGEPLYRDGLAPDAAETARRVSTYWRPYHVALSSELVRLHGLHGHAVLLDGHSIQAELPWLFEGRLPDLNLGTAGGASCAPALRERLAGVLAAHPSHSHIVDGRFKGGYITRHYGRPADGVHAVQMEMGWHCYMTPPHDYDEARAAAVLPVLRGIVDALIGWQP